MREGYVKVFRKFKKWQWYDDINAKCVFLHCLLSANWEDKEWRGIIIKRGEFVTSIEKMSLELKLSPMKIRTALKKLYSTNELSKKVTNKYHIITICNYDTYQDIKNQDNNQITNNITNKQQSNNNQITTTKELKELKEINNISLGCDFGEDILKIIEIYPRKGNPIDDASSIKNALQREFDKPTGKTESEILNYFLEKTKLYADSVANWSVKDKKFVSQLTTFFDKGFYNNDQINWQRGELKPQKVTKALTDEEYFEQHVKGYMSWDTWQEYKQEQEKCKTQN